MRPSTIAATVLALAACRAQDRTRPVASDLERGLFFTENATGRERYALSADAAQVTDDQGQSRPARARVVPDPVQVDLDSGLHVRVDRRELTGGRAARAPLVGIDALEDEIARTRRFLDFLSGSIGEQVRALEEAEGLLSLPAAERRRPDVERRIDELVGERLRTFERRVLDQVEELWPEESEAGEQVDDLLEEPLDAQTLARVNRFTDDQLARLERKKASFAQRLEERRGAMKLRLEAFLVPREPGSQPAAIHVPGYDRLPEGRLESRDRLGLDLSPREEERLRDLVEASFELAEAAESVRAEQRSLQEAFRDVTTLAGQRLAEEIVRVDALVERLEGQALDGRLDRLQEELRTFWEGYVQEVGERAADKVDAVRALPDEFLASTLAADPTRRVLALVARAGALRDRTRDLRPEQVLDVYLEGRALVDEAGALWEELFEEGAAIEVLAGALQKIGRELPAILLDDADVGQLLLDRWQDSPAKQRADELLADVEDVRDLLQAVARIVGGVPEPPKIELPRVPEALDVDLESAPDTQIDLQRTPRVVGDHVIVKATLLEGDQEVDSSQASFRIGRYGYQASLHPSVVFVEADELAGADNKGGFSPAVAWMHSFQPRPQDDAWYHGLGRFLDPAFGLHAAFLNYSPDNDTQFGLGVSLSFWGQRLQLGYGYNLNADGRDEGERYFYIGSSLFALLNDVQEIGGR